MKERKYDPRNPECNVCGGTGKYDPQFYSGFLKATKPHKCKGSCQFCGQYFEEVKIDFIYDKLEKIEHQIDRLIKYWEKKHGN